MSPLDPANFAVKGTSGVIRVPDGGSGGGSLRVFQIGASLTDPGGQNINDDGSENALIRASGAITQPNKIDDDSIASVGPHTFAVTSFSSGSTVTVAAGDAAVIPVTKRYRIGCSADFDNWSATGTNIMLRRNDEYLGYDREVASATGTSESTFVIPSRWYQCTAGDVIYVTAIVDGPTGSSTNGTVYAWSLLIEWEA